MDILKYNPKFVPGVRGLSNFGNTCYFNSLIQCLLSCSSLNEYVLKINDNDPDHNSLILTYKYFLISAMDPGAAAPTDKHLFNLWELLLKAAAKRKKDRILFSRGQQDVQEGFLLFIEALNNKYIERLFNHRCRVQAMCPSCGKICINNSQDELVLNICYTGDATGPESQDINEYLIKNMSEIDADHKCGLCGVKSAKKKITSIVMSPEILCLSINKYYNKYMAHFPRFLEFTYIDNSKKLVYELVAQSEQSGNMSGGHYWAIVRRKDGNFVCNDSQVYPKELGPTMETYMVFYHFVGLR